MGDVKKRNWAFVLYPESAPSDWREQLQSTGLQCAISPLHEFDTNPTGECKKAHYHIILAYSGPTSYRVVKSLCDKLNCPIPQPLEQIKGMYRYLTHKDNPEKFQYDEKDITTINGFNIADFCTLTVSDEDAMYSSLEDIVLSNSIKEPVDLMFFLKKNDYCTELSFYRRHSFYINEIIKSNRCRK